MGWRSSYQSTTRKFGMQEAETEECYKKFGDLGDAEYIASSKGRQALFSKPKALSIMDVYTTLIKFQNKKAGVRRKREAMMLSLFRRCDASTSATYRWGCRDDTKKQRQKLVYTDRRRVPQS